MNKQHEQVKAQIEKVMSNIGPRPTRIKLILSLNWEILSRYMSKTRGSFQGGKASSWQGEMAPT